MNYIKEVALGLDKLVNALTFGDHRETISSRMGRALSRDNSNCVVCHWLCEALNLVDPNHCFDAVDERFRKKRDEGRPE